MANANTPRGFKPVAYADGRPYSGAVKTLPIASGYATAIYAGDLVKTVSGVINRAAAGDAIRGVAVGFKWVAASGVPQFSQYWPASTATLGSQNGEVLVVDDQGIVLEAQFTASTSAVAASLVNAHFNADATAGSAVTGLSAEGVDASANATTGKTLKFLGFAQRADNDTASAYARALFTPVLHELRANT